MTKGGKGWEMVTTIGEAEFSRMPHRDLFVWRRARLLPNGETEIRYAWDGDGKVRDSLMLTLSAADGLL